MVFAAAQKKIGIIVEKTVEKVVVMGNAALEKLHKTVQKIVDHNAETKFVTAMKQLKVVREIVLAN